MPVYISATALGRLGHPDGEMTLTRAAAKHGIIQMVPTLASCSMDEIFGAARPGQTMFFQLYVNKDRSITQKLVQEAERRGAKALCITVDAPQLGRREKDMRQKFDADGPAAQEDAGGAQDRSQGAARAISVRSTVIAESTVADGLHRVLSTLASTGMTLHGSSRSRACPSS
jgi:L-lactate dehydrogenase (cytochrome)